LYVLALWDLLVLALWVWDLNHLARPDQIEVRRLWDVPLGLAKPVMVALELHNSSSGSISALEYFRITLPEASRISSLVSVPGVVPAFGASFRKK